MTPDVAKTYNKQSWSERPKSKSARVRYHKMPPEDKEAFLAYQRDHQRSRRELQLEELNARRREYRRLKAEAERMQSTFTPTEVSHDSTT
jgi:hypothetical protein